MSQQRNENSQTRASRSGRNGTRPRRTNTPSDNPVEHVDAPLGTRCAGENPTLRTLRSLSADKKEEEQQDVTEYSHQPHLPSCQNNDEELSLKSVRNVRNGENSCCNGAQRLPHAAQRPEPPGEDDDIDVEDAAGFRRGFLAQPVRGVLRVGRMRCSREHFSHFENPDLIELLAEQVPPDTVIEAEKGAEFSVVDVDVHHWSSPPSDDLLNTNLATFTPTPEAAWISHGRGLKLVYIGPYHADRALAAAFGVPQDMKVELLTRTRHPRSLSTAHEGTCGPVQYYDTDPEQQFLLRHIGPPTREERDETLRRLNLADGDRFDHDRCPIDPTADSDAKGCVVVSDRGVYCYRCAGHGIHYEGVALAGFLPFRNTDGGSYGELDGLAEHRVHWAHARLVLRHHFPHISEGLLERAYHKVLEARWKVDDPRIAMVFNPGLDYVRAGEGWLTSLELKPTELDNDACSALPYVLDAYQNEDGKWKTKTDYTKRSTVKNRTPVGYPPIRPVYGLSFARDRMEIPVPKPTSDPHPVELLSRPLPIDAALARLESAFPKLNSSYLFATLAAAICGEAKMGQPAMLACTGPSGSGKEQTIRLAASFLCEDIRKLSLTDDEEKFFRNLADAVNQGSRFLVFDELGKNPNLLHQQQLLLQISSVITHRQLYSKTSQSEMRAALFFPCVSFPEFLLNSQEFNRRCCSIHLPFRIPHWGDTCGGDTNRWRRASAENARVANSILTHVWSICREYDFQFNGPVAETLGLGRLSDDAPGMDPAFLRRLYRHARNEDGQRVMFENDNSFKGGWVDLSSSGARALIDAYVEEHADLGTKKAREAVKANLEAQPWSEILGIDDPPIVCKLNTRSGTKWGIRFQSGHAAMRGQEARNEQLPPSPIRDDAVDIAGVTIAVTSTQVPAPLSRQIPDATTVDDAADILRKAGFPS